MRQVIKVGNKKRRIKIEPSSSSDKYYTADEIARSNESSENELLTIEDLREEIIQKSAEEDKEELLGLYEAKTDFKVGHWVLVRFDIKNKKNVHFVGQIMKFSDVRDLEVVFLRKHSENKQGTTFTWPVSRDETEVT